MVRHSYSVLLPCLNTQAIKTHSIKTIESLLREGLGTIEEEEEVFTPSPSPAATGTSRPVRSPSAGGRQLQRKMSMQKRRVSAKLTKSPKGVWQLRISKFSTVVSAPLSTIGDSYVRMMNGLMDKGNLGELAMFNNGYDSFMYKEERADSIPPRSISRR